MIPQIKENIQLIIVISIWFLTGAYFGVLSVGVIGASMLLFAARDSYADILIGFWFILIFSDSMEPAFLWAADAKKVMILVLLVIFFLRRKTLILGKNDLFSVYVPFFIWSLLIVYDNPRALLAFQKTLSYVLLFLMVPVFTRYALQQNQRGFFKSITLMMIIYLSLGVLMRYVDMDIAFQAGRFRGLMGNPNGLGVLAFVFFILFDTLAQKMPKLLPRWQIALVWILVFMNLFLCQSRSALFAILLYILFSRVRLLSGFIGLLAFIAILFSYGYIQTNLESIVYEFGLENVIRTENLEGGSGRLIAWEFAWAQIQDNFFIGRGFTYTDWIFWQNYDLLTSLGHLGNAHNSFLTFWLDTGLIGLVLYVVAFFLMFWRVNKVNSNVTPLMYAVLFSASFESWLTASLNPLTIQVLMILSIMLYARQEDINDEGEEDEVKKLTKSRFAG